jgi:hypothetical protein
MMELHPCFLSLLSPGLQKVSRNKTVGCKTLSITQTNCIIKAFKEEKTMKKKITKRTVDIVAAFAAAV